MMACDSPDDLYQEFVVDCGYTRVIACRVGALGASVVRAAKHGDFTRVKREKPPSDSNGYIPRFPSGKLREFTLEELGKATDTFNVGQMIGKGGFGKVFKGMLSGGALVAVKILDSHSRPGEGQGVNEFQAEMRAHGMIMATSHPNLVPAIGFHSSRKGETDNVMIVYPFMSNGDVGRYLGDHRPSSPTPLNWPTRKKIALGLARGISCLHKLGIIHNDIKPSNVMLDEDFNAKVGDLGLAKFVSLPSNSHNAACFHGDEGCNYYDTHDIWGTYGYIAPETASTGLYSRKSDVFAFGVTLIQLVTGNQVFERSEKGRGAFLVERAAQLFENDENLTRLMHPGMSGTYDESEAIELIRLALICTQHEPQRRPVMPEVISVMEGRSANLKLRWDNYDYPRFPGQLSYISQSITGFSTNGVDSFFSNDSVLSGDASNNGVSGSMSTSLANSMSLKNDTLEDDIVRVDPSEGGDLKQLSCSRTNRYEEQSDKVTAKLKEKLDQMRAMELNHQARMEEMHQKQIATMRSMIEMQEQYIMKFNEMQTQIDQLQDATSLKL